MRTQPLFAAMALLALAGCAADPAPHEQMRLSEQALEQAKAVGATDEVAELKLAEARVLTFKSQEQLSLLQSRVNRLRKQLGEQQ